MHHQSAELKQCSTTAACYQECLSTAMIHCLEMGGEHTEPDHFRLMIARTSLLKTPLCCFRVEPT